jgi:helix-turn-helix protein
MKLIEPEDLFFDRNKAREKLIKKMQPFTIKKSTRGLKKYMFTKDNKTIHFGARDYEQYKDNTPLQLFKSQDHGDDLRRELYLKRHKKSIENAMEKYGFFGTITPALLSLVFLW